MAGRLQGAKRARGGAWRVAVPDCRSGYVHDEDGQTIIDPDRGGCGAAIADVFCRVRGRPARRTGCVGAVQGPAVPEARVGRGVGGRAAVGCVEPLAGRADAARTRATRGAYAFGRCRSRRVVRPDGTITTTTVELPPLEWPVLIATITPATSPGMRISPTSSASPANHTREGQRPPREGRRAVSGDRALRRVRALDERSVPREGRSLRLLGLAREPHQDPGAAGRSRRPCVDELVARRLLAALAPEEIAVALAAADEVVRPPRAL